jgi:hypothetical protein
MAFCRCGGEREFEMDHKTAVMLEWTMILGGLAMFWTSVIIAAWRMFNP